MAPVAPAAAAAGLNPLTGAAILAGGSILQGLGSLFGGGERRRRIGSTFRLLQNRLGQSIFDPRQLLGSIKTALRPQNEAIAQGFQKRGIFDSILGQAGIAQQQAPLFASLFNALQVKNAELTAGQDANIFSNLSSLAVNT